HTGRGWSAAVSALGQKQTCAVQNGMSALPPKVDIERLPLSRQRPAAARATAATSVYGRCSPGHRRAARSSFRFDDRPAAVAVLVTGRIPNYWLTHLTTASMQDPDRSAHPPPQSPPPARGVGFLS